MSQIAEHWDVDITPDRGLFNLGLRDVWAYRDLVLLFVRRNFAVNYRQTILGPLWYLVQPLTTTGVFTMIFGVIAKLPTDQIPPSLFYLSGVVMWTSFSTNLLATSDVFAVNMGLFGKVYFPRLTVPIATVLTNCVTLVLHLAVFVAVYLANRLTVALPAPSLWVIATPLLFAANMLLAVSFGLVFSAFTTRYRDLVPLVGYGLQLWMYLTPIVYPMSQVPERFKVFMALNPVSTLVELFRLAVFGRGSASFAQVAISLCVMAGVLALGLVLFSRAERDAADTV